MIVAFTVRKALQQEYADGDEIDDSYAEKLLNFNDEEGKHTRQLQLAALPF